MYIYCKLKIVLATEKKWYALYTKSRWEKKVLASLEAKGIDVYLPLVKTLKMWSDRKKMVEEPLFRSYIFVHISPTEYDPAVKTPGVVRYVTFRGKAVAVPPREIEAVKAYIGEGDERVDRQEEYHPGEAVEVVRGVMRGLQGRLVEVKGRRRVLVEIGSIGERLVINLPAAYLQKIPS